MNDSIVWFGIVSGVLVILGLGWFIKRKLAELKTHQAVNLQQAAEKEKQQAYLINSLKVLATSILDDQVELSEGCIRVKVLIDHLDAKLHAEERFKIFEEMYLATEHMPTHQARKDTDEHFIKKLDQQRFGLEQKNRDTIRTAAKALLEHFAA